MLEWVQGLGGPQVATALLWALAALILLVLVLVLARLIRSLTFGTFVAGGRNRKTRLAVMDATAVDSHRRLVLIRRDDTEHLLLIGGPTDVVVERDIRLSQVRRPALTAHAGHDSLPQPRPRLPEPATRLPEPAAANSAAAAPQPPRPTAPLPSSPPPAAPAARRPSPPQTMRSPERPQAPQAPAARPVSEVALPPAAPHRPPPAAIPAAPPQHAANGSGTHAPNRPAAPVAGQNSSSLDETLLRELEVTFEPTTQRVPLKPPELTLDEEMTKLLGELSSHKRS